MTLNLFFPGSIKTPIWREWPFPNFDNIPEISFACLKNVNLLFLGHHFWPYFEINVYLVFISPHISVHVINFRWEELRNHRFRSKQFPCSICEMFGYILVHVYHCREYHFFFFQFPVQKLEFFRLKKSNLYNT